MKAMRDELNRSFTKLAEVGDTRTYFIAYSVVEENFKKSFLFSQGALVREGNPHRFRRADVEIRIGNRSFDSTHYLRNTSGRVRFSNLRPFSLPIDDHPEAIRAALWIATDRSFKDALEKLAELRTNVSLKVDEQDTSDDFSKESPVEFSQSAAPFNPNLEQLKFSAKDLSRMFLPHPWIYNSQVNVMAHDNVFYYANTEGTQLVIGENLLSLAIHAHTVAADGMELRLYKNYYARSENKLPPSEMLRNDVADLIQNLSHLREAPIVEPYSGPAIISGRAAAVFFHEILGHRLEGHRNRIVAEGQTFVQKLGQKILPDFMSIVDDPSRTEYRGNPLNGHYTYDDEGVAAQNVTLIDSGILKNFLMCRKPVRGFPASNGHGRRSLGRFAVARQGNLIVESSQTVSPDRLREMLINECRKQGKPFGYVFLEIEGGFTFTGRDFPQAFKVLPLLVKRVYADGRPDEWVRGVDIVGTPLTGLEQILAVGDDPEIFNGVCGAESGSVAVSAVSPSILVKSIEIEKAKHEQERPPILPPPGEAD